MKFRRLRLAGFKSFVEPAELRIEEGLTGVVGPNGCGKSNLLEAMRWVMGESSPKSMRGGGMEDVIFAGTGRRPARDLAQVTLRLDNSARQAPAQFNDSDEIEVTRHIERGLGSAYRINGRDVRQRDVQLLFADAATGAHSPALVSQGRVGAIINAKPQDRRLLLEDAAGIAGLHVRRREAEQRLKAAEANLARLADLLSGLEARAAALRRQARAAERYARLTQRIELAEAMLVHTKWRRAKAEAEAGRADLETLEQELAAAAAEQERLEKLQTEAKAGLPQLRAAAAEAAEARNGLAREGDRLASEAGENERRLRDLRAGAELAESDRGREAAVKADAAAAIERLEREGRKLAEQGAGARAALPDAAERAEAAERAVQEAEHALAGALSGLAEARAERRGREAAAKAADERLVRAKEALGRAEAAAASVPDRAGLQADVTSAREALDEAEQALAAARDELDKGERRRHEIERERQAAEEALAAAAAALSGMQAEIGSLSRRVEQEAAETARPVLSEVTVEPGFEAALAAALGAAVKADLDDPAAAMHWEERTAEDAPAPLPAGAVTLLDHVSAPRALHPRLCRTGVVSGPPDEKAIRDLSPGQMLVSREGAVWRWDGLRIAGGAEAGAAELLAARNRLASLEEDYPAAEARHGRAAAMRGDTRSRLAEVSARLQQTRRQQDEADAARGAASTALAKAQGAAERAQGQADAAREVLEGAGSAAAAARGEAEAAERALTGAPREEPLSLAVEQARRTADRARANLAEARADRQTLERAVRDGEERSRRIESETADWRRRLGDSDRQQAALSQRMEAARSEAAQLEERAGEIGRIRADLACRTKELDAVHQQVAQALAQGEEAASVHDEEARAAAVRLAELKERRGRLGAQCEAHDLRRVEMNRIASERFRKPAHILPAAFGFDEDEAEEETRVKEVLDRLMAERERMGPVNLRAETELAELNEEIGSSNADSEDLHAAIARLRGSIGAINREGRARLLTAFEEVDRHFRSLFTGLFGGGAARLELVESDDPLRAGLEIMAQPPGKALQSMSLLSGGEQALTAVALIFSIFLTNPAPICVLDEVDAPLDDANVERFCDLLDRMTMLTDTRFLIVTHNAVTMSRMHRLYGVTMQEKGVSQLVSVDLGGAETLLAAE